MYRCHNYVVIMCSGHEKHVTLGGGGGNNIMLTHGKQ